MITAGRPNAKGMSKTFLGVFEPILFARPYLKNGTRLFILVITAGIISNVSLLLVPVYIGQAVSALQKGAFSSIPSIGLFIILPRNDTGLVRSAKISTAETRPPTL